MSVTNVILGIIAFLLFGVYVKLDKIHSDLSEIYRQAVSASILRRTSN